MRLRYAPLALLLSLAAAAPSAAQQPPPRIGPFVVDLRASFPKFPDDQQLADSRGLSLSELPGMGIGGALGVHVYLLKWRAITFGVGGEVMAGQSHFTPLTTNGQTAGGVPVTERFVTASPQISFNFGTGTGWSYLSAGLGQSQWQVVPDGTDATSADTERLRTLNYGGGARWFAKKHLAFNMDVRLYAIDPGSPHFGFPGSPRTTLLVLNTGISIK